MFIETPLLIWITKVDTFKELRQIKVWAGGMVDRMVFEYDDGHFIPLSAK